MRLKELPILPALIVMFSSVIWPLGEKYRWMGKHSTADYAPSSEDHALSSADHAPPSADHAPPSADHAPSSVADHALFLRIMLLLLRNILDTLHCILCLFKMKFHLDLSHSMV